MTNALLIASFTVLAACEADRVRPAENTPPPKWTIENLTERWHVLNNLEAAYNQRNSTEYARLIDPDEFVFYFSAEDFSNGRTPEKWGPAEENAATTALLQDALNIDLDVVFSPDQILWTPLTPDSFPDEIWFVAVVNYTFSMRFNSDPETTFQTANQPQTSFTVRSWDDNGTERWRLVEWRDLAGSLSIIPRSSSVEETSWGRVKALYN